MAKRGEALELAVLGLLHGSPLHGYELRKQLTGVLGWGRVLSFGSLYPCLKSLVRLGYIAEQKPDLDPEQRPSRRAKIVYALTADGKERFDDLVSGAGPSAWDDDNFGVHFAFFGAASAETRLRILEGRRSRLEERVDGVRTALARSRERVDAYTLELQKHGLESVEREVRWLNELIHNERAGQAPAAEGPPADDPPHHPALGAGGASPALAGEHDRPTDN
jgi:DNA-binding PadR family transcriptional regulator